MNVSFWIFEFTNLLVSCFMTASVSAVVMFGPIAFLEKKLPWQGNIWKRFILEFFLTEITAVTSILILFYVLSNLGIHGPLPTDDVSTYVAIEASIGFIMNAILVSIYEGIVLFNLWKESLLQNERLKQENLKSKYETLKNQVNPHFLFNSLNTLSNLIHEDADKAEQFVDEFSYIYRYVLEVKDKTVVSLEEEMKFAKAYMDLCQIRFGDALKCEFKVDIDLMQLYLPTLTLQTLIENAIKHNRITRKEPLTIQISDEDGGLIVKNNYQPRENKINSTGLGLNNIKERYALYCHHQPEFFVNGNSYIARLPLLKPT